jgi:AraC-like DNA-binding protein
MSGHGISSIIPAMRETLPERHKVRLEGLCEGATAGAGATARIRLGPGCDGIERLQAFFGARAFSPHRHDTYAIGITLAGVQTFSYRGERRHCLPGQCHILHPDELHDGQPGTDEGFGYRIAYIDPSLIQEAMGGMPLPFVPNPVKNLSSHQKQMLSALWDMVAQIDDLGRIEITAAAADLLLAIASNARPTPALRLPGLLRVRDAIIADPAKRHSIEVLERLAELDRWSLARQFRSAFGTSPSRFRTLRQLDVVRTWVKRGTCLAEASLRAGFADQSHMSRQFKLAYGMTPARWAAALVR